MVAASATRTALVISLISNVAGTGGAGGTLSRLLRATPAVTATALVAADLTVTSPGVAQVVCSAVVAASAVHVAVAHANIPVSVIVTGSLEGSQASNVAQKPASFDYVMQMPAAFDHILYKGASKMGVKAPITVADNWFVGEDQVFEFTSVTSGAVDNISGWTLEWNLATAAGQTAILTVAGSIISASGGVFDVTIAAADTLTLEPGVYYYDVSRTDSTHNQVLAFGKANLQARVA